MYALLYIWPLANASRFVTVSTAEWLQREPRWGRNDNSPGALGVHLTCTSQSHLTVTFLPPGEDAYLEGQYGAWMVLGGQGADANGHYRYGEKRKALCEMKHFDAYSVEDGRDGITDTFDISLRDLVDYYFVPLKSCIDIADVGAFMCTVSTQHLCRIRTQND
eukprot:COSAG02_NODE_170_length_31534_cov_33.568498_22_plen_163_part_00